MRPIDADAFIEKMKGTNRYFAVKLDIAEAPTLDVEPVVQAHWEVKEDPAYDFVNIHCPVCGADADIEANNDPLPKRCWNCGAKMDLEDATDNNANVMNAEFVVHCRDCKQIKKAKVNDKGFLICPASGMEITDDDFCSYGEREEAEDDSNRN